MDTRRSFLKKAALLSGGAGLLQSLPPSIQKALAIDAAPGSSFYDAEHIVFLMQENRSFDHTFGTLQGVRGFNDPRAILLPDKNKVWLQTNKEGETYAPFRLDIKDTKITWMGCLPHSWTNQVDARNEGKFDKWLDVKHSGNKEFDSMPLTMGYYNREDIPFYYSLADAFTVCDQHFCSSLTGTTPNRLHFWGGTIRGKQEPAAQANVWNGDADYDNYVNWKNYPERLEEQGVSWKVYQNEISSGAGPEGEADGWLTNFGDNPLEYFTQYNVKLSREYIAYLPVRKALLEKEIKELEQQIQSPQLTAEEQEKLRKQLSRKNALLDIVTREQGIFTTAKYEALSPFEKNIHDKAFANNRKDPHYHELAPLTYQEGGASRTLQIPKGDILHQFREDVNSGQLPTVSWLVAPQYFSDHPDSPWFGAWYVSEVMDILTTNPEVWKKTIFVLTYDENDGYFDHVPPFVAPNPYKPHTGKVSEGIDTKMEFVTADQQSSKGDSMRESAIGLGFRVPMVIASPWSKGGFVCSEVFDHTSSLQFLENFLYKKTGKKITETNINAWRRTVCGDLSTAFRTYEGEKTSLKDFIEKEKFIESIHQAQFKQAPANFKKLSKDEIAAINQQEKADGLMPVQETGTRPSCALRYELYADGNFDHLNKTVQLSFRAGNTVFGSESAGSPFCVYAMRPYTGEQHRTWDYAVKPGFEEKDEFKLSDFSDGRYQLRVYGPNGFYREFTGTAQDPAILVNCDYEAATGKKQLTGNTSIAIQNKGTKPVTILVKDNSYKSGTKEKLVKPGERVTIVTDQSKSHGWYDFSLTVKGTPNFEKRFAGHVETGKVSITDPLMGGVI